MIVSRGVEFVGRYGGRIPGQSVIDAVPGLCLTRKAIEYVCCGERKGDNPHPS